ncbi:ribonuclease pancreatic beta-type-like [Etheostoma cragini]|uniref:ribonuclease pancreatic beta-type-like n=1 Tax=Etheostoma cragini TaxID=417921 RepID=UPI00155F4FEC|nr:ribonuclease pancreatic beta-type-like [Etheostoma cragini]
MTLSSRGYPEGPAERYGHIKTTMKISVSAAVLLLSAAVLSLDSGEGEDPVEKFKRQHIYEKMGDHDCTAVMKQRRITNKGQCKRINTFINATFQRVEEVCTKGKNDNENFYESKAIFNVVVCTRKQIEGYPSNCEFTDTVRNGYIIIACNNNNPVHFESLLLPGVPE